MRFSVGVKVWGLVLLPVVALAVLSTLTVLEGLTLWSQSEKGLQQAGRLSQLSAWMLEVQKERGLTLTAVLAGSDQVPVRNQRAVVDALYQDKDLSGVLSTLRTASDSGTPESAFSVFDRYSDLVSRTLDRFGVVSREPAPMSLRDQFLVWYQLELAKERAAAFRGWTSALLGRDGAVTAAELGEANRLRDEFLVLMEVTSGRLSDADALAWSDYLSGSDWELLGQNLAVLSARSSQGNFGIDSAAYFQLATSTVTAIQGLTKSTQAAALTRAASLVASAQTTFWTQIVVLLLVLGLVVGLGAAILNAILRPLQRVLGSLEQFSQGAGDLTVQIPDGPRDEIGDLSRYFNLFVIRLRELLEGLKKEAEKVAAVSAVLVEETGQSASSTSQIFSSGAMVVQNSQVQLLAHQRAKDVVDRFVGQIRQIDETTAEMRSQMQSAASGVEEIAASLETTTTLSDRTRQSAEKAAEASASGSESVLNLSQTVDLVANLAENIGEMTSLIADIAGQTNLLSMNAAIEAAHAGDAGKGFAVVAEEIRRLAETSAVGANTIQKTVKQVQNGIMQTRDLTKITVNAFDILRSEIDGLQKASRELSASMEEQGQANRSVLISVGEVSRLADTTSQALAEQSHQGLEVLRLLDDLGNASERNREASMEQVVGLQQIEAASRQLNAIAVDLEASSAKIRLDFGQFKTDLGTIDLNKAIYAHEQWKIRLAAHLSGKKPLEIAMENVARDDHCALGEWIHGDGKEHAGTPGFDALVQSHAAFHRIAADVARNGDSTSAGKLLSAGSPFGRASRATIGQIKKLQLRLHG